MCKCKRQHWNTEQWFLFETVLKNIKQLAVPIHFLLTYLYYFTHVPYTITYDQFYLFIMLEN